MFEILKVNVFFIAKKKVLVNSISINLILIGVVLVVGQGSCLHYLYNFLN